jgi:RNase P subunit RPR2
MRSPGVDLLLRVVADQLGRQQCEGCGSPLAGGRFALREQTAQRIVVEVACPTCNRKPLLFIQPDVDGVAQIK